MDLINLISTPLAYVGPGAGMGLLMALIGLATAIGGALLAIAWWPIRKLLKKTRKPQACQ